MTRILCLILTNFNPVLGQEITKILLMNDDDSTATFLPNPQLQDLSKVLEFKTLPNEIHQNNEDFTLFTFFNNSKTFQTAPKLLFGCTFFNLLALTQEEKQLECNKELRGVRMKSLSLLIMDKNIPFLFSCENALKHGLKEIFFMESLTSMTAEQKESSIDKIMNETFAKLSQISSENSDAPPQIPHEDQKPESFPESPENFVPSSSFNLSLGQNREEKEFILSIFKFLLFQHPNPKTHSSLFMSNSITVHRIPLNFMTLLKCLLLQESFLIFGSDMQDSTFKQFSLRTAGLLKISRLAQEIKKTTLPLNLKMNQELIDTVRSKCKKLFPYFLLTIQEVFSQSNALLDTFMDPTKGLNEYFYMVSFTDKIFFNHLSKYVDTSSKNTKQINAMKKKVSKPQNPEKKEPFPNESDKIPSQQENESEEIPPNILSMFPIVINLEDNEVLVLEHVYQSAKKAKKLKNSLQISKSDAHFLNILKDQISKIEDPTAKEKELELFICTYTKSIFQELSIKNDLNRRRLMNYSSISDIFSNSLKLDHDDGPFLERLAHTHACNIQFSNDSATIQEKIKEQQAGDGLFSRISTWFSYLNCCSPNEPQNMVVD